jgi:two-component system response regulator AtoC
MAGSQADDIRSLFIDPVLTARLEALKLLADRVSDRVMVLNRDLTIIYASRSAWAGSDLGVGLRPARCYEAFLQRTEPCEACPATKVFESGSMESVPCSIGGGGMACGMHQAFPLLSSQGEAASVLVLVKNGAEDTTPHNRLTRKRPEDETQPEVDECRLGGLIGRSPSMRQLFEMLRLVADSHATVLVQGESGTGKELVARTIHRLSDRRDRPFVVVDCGSLPETLLESELFGHVKGAFTGAVSSKRGLFDEAHGGTIFLDEIADTSPRFQSKLLRVLQEGEIKPVGSSRSIKVDVRVISATNKDLLELVKAKAFRQDLYYRLAVLPLFLAPLRERREDIPLLVSHFVAASCKRHRKPVRRVTTEAMQTLIHAPWPGNIRELQHFIERVVVTTSGAELTCKDVANLAMAPLPDDLRSVSRGAAQQAERARILEALRQVSGNRTRLAKMLKISRAGLYNKLRAYGLVDV